MVEKEDDVWRRCGGDPLSSDTGGGMEVSAPGCNAWLFRLVVACDGEAKRSLRVLGRPKLGWVLSEDRACTL